MNTHAEKRGTANWVQCQPCKDWFHVSASLLAKPDALLHCPYCHHEFKQADAARVVTGG